MEKYTVTVNYGEYAEGIFDTEALADSYRAKKILKDEPDTNESMAEEELLAYDAEGYYGTLTIRMGEG